MIVVSLESQNPDGAAAESHLDIRAQPRLCAHLRAREAHQMLKTVHVCLRKTVIVGQTAFSLGTHGSAWRQWLSHC